MRNSLISEPTCLVSDQGINVKENGICFLKRSRISLIAPYTVIWLKISREQTRFRGKRTEIQSELLFFIMELNEIFEWMSAFVCENPFWSIIGAALTPTAIIQVRKFYLEYVSELDVKIIGVKILPRDEDLNLPKNKICFLVQAELVKKTRKLIHIKKIECRILTDSVKTEWHPTQFAPEKIDLTDGRTRNSSCCFFESPDYFAYEFEFRVTEDGSNKQWSSKSKKYKIVNSQLVENN